MKEFKIQFEMYTDDDYDDEQLAGRQTKLFFFLDCNLLLYHQSAAAIRDFILW